MCCAVRARVRQVVEQRIDQRGDGRSPIQPRPSDAIVIPSCAAEMNRSDRPWPEQHPAEAMALVDHLLDAAAAQADQRELGGDEERVQEDEYPDRRQAYRDVWTPVAPSVRAGRPHGSALGGHDP